MVGNPESDLTGLERYFVRARSKKMCLALASQTLSKRMRVAEPGVLAGAGVIEPPSFVLAPGFNLTCIHQQFSRQYFRELCDHCLLVHPPTTYEIRSTGLHFARVDSKFDVDPLLRLLVDGRLLWH
jgi:hypothetical protein